MVRPDKPAGRANNSPPASVWTSVLCTDQWVPWVNAGFFTLEKVGRTYRYWPVWEAADRPLEHVPKPGKKSGFETKTPDIFDGNTGHFHRKSSDKTNRLSFLPDPPSILAAPNEADDPGNANWLSVKGRLSKRLSDGELASWINRLQFKRLSEHEVVLIGPSKYHCSHIENGYIGDRLLEAWQAEQTTIARVILVAAERAAR